MILDGQVSQFFFTNNTFSDFVVFEMFHNNWYFISVSKYSLNKKLDSDDKKAKELKTESEVAQIPEVVGILHVHFRHSPISFSVPQLFSLEQVHVALLCFINDQFQCFTIVQFRTSSCCVHFVHSLIKYSVFYECWL